MENLFVFHGTDHKCGTTMVAQSVAEIIAEQRKNINVLMISLNGRKSNEYVSENIAPIDNYKLQIDSGIIIDKNIIAKNKHKDNLYMVGGIEKELEQRYYLPNTAAKLLEGMTPQFEIIIADTGSEIDNGLAIGGLSLSKLNMMVMTQNESAVCRYEKNREIFNQLKINFDAYLINKFCEDDPYSLSYFSQRLGIPGEKLKKIHMANCGRQAEMEYRTFVNYNEEQYIQDVIKISNIILQSCNMEEIKFQRKKKWKSFI